VPTIGAFHATFWRARANPIVPPGPAVSGAYYHWQSTNQSGAVLALAIWGLPDLRRRGRQLRAWVEAWIRRLVWSWRTARGVWRWRVWADQSAARLGQPGRFDDLTIEQLAVLERVLGVMHGPAWVVAQQEVRTCATSPKFHQPEQWVTYSRAVKANPGQAQNIWRHVKVVASIQAAQDVTNADAHLLAELAYQGMAAMGRPDRQIVHHATLH
jgi:hypothetical protein